MTLTVADQLDVAIILDAEYLPKLQASMRLYLRHTEGATELSMLALPFPTFIADVVAIAQRLNDSAKGDSWKKKLEGLNS